MTNEALLQKIEMAFKNVIETSDLGTSILQPEKFDRFVRVMEEATTILPLARFIRMESQITDIDRTGFVGRILKSGHTAAAGGGVSRALGTAEFSQPAFNTNRLTAQELMAITSLRDEALRRNIERGAFENTLIDIFGAAAGRDLEEYALLADTDIVFGDDDVLSQTDGWCKLAGSKLYGQGVGADFALGATNYPENIFNTMLETLPKKYLGNISDWHIFVPWEIYNAYQDLLKARGTALGDSAQVGMPKLYYKGINITYCPILERARDVAVINDGIADGRLCLLSNPDNMAWGIFHQVQVEKEREAKLRRTDFVLTFEGDSHYEDEDAVVLACLDKQAP